MCHRNTLLLGVGRDGHGLSGKMLTSIWLRLNKNLWASGWNLSKGKRFHYWRHVHPQLVVWIGGLRVESLVLVEGKWETAPTRATKPRSKPRS